LVIVVASKKTNEPPVERLFVFVAYSVPKFSNKAGEAELLVIVRLEPLSAIIAP
jgi:hypothetical protein